MSAERWSGDGLVSIEDRERIERRLEIAAPSTAARPGQLQSWRDLYAQDVALLVKALNFRRPVDANVDPVAPSHPETARKMAAKALGRSGTKRRVVYDWIAGRFPGGATAEEVGQRFGWQHQSYSAVVSHLASDGWLVPARDDDGEVVTRLTSAFNHAIVWVAVPEFSRR